MRRIALISRLCTLGMMIAVHCCWAQAPERDRGPQVPIAGPAPLDEGLPPLPDEMRQKAALQMMIVVVVALALIILLLHVFGRRMKLAAPPATPEQELTEKVDRVLRERDSGPGEDETRGT